MVSKEIVILNNPTSTVGENQFHLKSRLIEFNDIIVHVLGIIIGAHKLRNTNPHHN